MTLLTPTASSQAADFCVNLDGQRTIVGEARYEVHNGSDFAYANAYWDGGAELGLPRGGVIGAVPSAGGSLEFLVYGHHEDFVAGDCASMGFRVLIDRSNTDDGTGCPSFYTRGNFGVTINSCSGGNADFLFAGRTFGLWYSGYRRYFRSTVEVDSLETFASDEGCWQLLTDNECELVNP